MKRTPTNVLSWLCEDLQIAAPVRFAGWEEENNGRPETTMGGCARVWDVNCAVRYDISVRKNQSAVDILHVFAHEARHAWQYENGKLTSQYGMWEGRDYLETTEYHRDLPEELDAEAYAESIIDRLIAVFGA